MLNKVILMGRLTRDPELTTATTGNSIVRFSLAVDRRFVKPGEERQADFINVVAFKQTADFVKKYFVKGQLVCVAGSLQTNTWEKDGKKNYATDVIADEVHFTGDKGKEQGQAQQPLQDDGFMTVDDSDLPF